MDAISRVLVFASLLVIAADPALAVQPRGLSGGASNVVSTTARVDRGGTISAVDRAKLEIVVDGISYELPATVKIFAASGSKQIKAVQLTKGMKIRFLTEKNYSSEKNVVREVWVVSPASN